MVTARALFLGSPQRTKKNTRKVKTYEPDRVAANSGCVITHKWLILRKGPLTFKESNGLPSDHQLAAGKRGDLCKIIPRKLENSENAFIRQNKVLKCE